MAKIILAMGHTLYGAGFGAVWGNNVESIMTRDVGAMIIQRLSDIRPTLRNEYKVIATDLSNDYIKEQADYINKFGADYAFQFHFNCFTNPDSKGTEVIEWTESAMAKNLSQVISETLGTVNRGNKIDQKLKFLRTTKCKSFILEPCFISNQWDMVLYNDKKQEYVNKVIDFCEKNI